MSHDLEQQKLARLDALTQLYARALGDLVDGDFDAAMTAVDTAGSLVNELSQLDWQLTACGGAQTPELTGRTEEVRALHGKLLGVLREQLGSLDGERRRMSMARRVVRGYRQSTPRRPKGSILDGTC